LPGHTFTDAIFNAVKPVNDDDLLVTVMEVGGQMDQFQYGQIHGNNFLTIVDADGAGIQSITIDSVDGFQDLRQVRVSGISGVTPTPEPSSALLFGSGILGLLGYFRRRL
jgi:hypothetical protein